MTVAGCTLVCQLSGEQLPSIATQCAWMAIGVASLVQVVAAQREKRNKGDERLS